MKIKLNQTSAGPEGVIPAGAIVNVDEATAKYLIDSRQGVEVKESFPEPPVTKTDTVTVETATSPEGETATWPNRRKPKEQAKEPIKEE
jgi:ribosomal protein L12E/L44/L45/RPP1/RPP2